MSAIQWEYDLVERPLCEQLVGMGWQWIEGDTQVAEFTERQTFREVLFRDYTEKELAVIKAKYATDGDVMEAPLLIERKARDMIRHYASVVLPEGYKAQVVATSRKAVMTYLEKLAKARDELVAELEALPPEIFTLSMGFMQREKTIKLQLAPLSTSTATCRLCGSSQNDTPARS